MQAAHVLLPGPRWIGPPSSWLGAVPICAGVWLHAAALRTLRNARTTVDPDGRPARLVRAGPYARTRNPMYLAGLPILAGWATLLGTSVPALALLGYGAAAARWVAHEERILAECFGEDWAVYRAAVRCWI